MILDYTKEHLRFLKLFAKLTFLIMLAIPRVASAEIIFEDFYDRPEIEGWVCADPVPSGYTGKANCPSPSTHNGVTRYAGEITSGGKIGNSLKLWRRNGTDGTFWRDYHGYLNYTFTEQEFAQGYKELFIRWYVKIPLEWDADLAGSKTHKLNRFWIGSSAGATTKEWLIDIKGSTFNTGRLSFYNTGGGGVWHTASTVNELGINDGNWHSLEWRLKLNSTTGSTDGAFQLFVNGEAITICDGMGQNCATLQERNVGALTDEYFTTPMPPAIGNLTQGVWDFPTDGWYAFEFDSYVLSTSRIGHAYGYDNLPIDQLNSPTGLQIIISP